MEFIPVIFRAAVTATLAAFMFATMGVAVRFASAELPNEMVVFLRSFFGLIFLLPWIYHHKDISLVTIRFYGHLSRSLAGLAAMYCFFYAIANLQLAEAILLNYTAPIFISVIALVWLKEKLSGKIMIAIITGFVGVCLILKPGYNNISQAAWIGLASGMLAALAMVSIRNLSTTEPTLRIVFYYSIITTGVSAFPLIWYWQTPDIKTLFIMVLAGLVASLGQLLLTYSYSLAPAARVGPYTYATVVFAAVYGWIFWSDKPDALMLAGAVLIIVAGIIALHTRSVPQIIDPE